MTEQEIIHHYNKAMELYSQEDYKGALEILLQPELKKHFKDNLDYLLQILKCLNQKEHFDQEYVYLEKDIVKELHFQKNLQGEYYDRLARSYFFNQDYKKAIKLIEKEETKEHYIKEYTLGSYYDRLSTLYHFNSQYNKVIEYLKKEETKQHYLNHTKLHNYFYNLATAYLKNNSYISAIHYFKQEETKESYNGEHIYHYNLGNAYYQNKQYESAIEHYTKAVELHQDDQAGVDFSKSRYLASLAEAELKLAQGEIQPWLKETLLFLHTRSFSLNVKQSIVTLLLMLTLGVMILFITMQQTVISSVYWGVLILLSIIISILTPSSNQLQSSIKHYKEADARNEELLVVALGLSEALYEQRKVIEKGLINISFYIFIPIVCFYAIWGIETLVPGHQIHYMFKILIVFLIGLFKDHILQLLKPFLLINITKNLLNNRGSILRKKIKDILNSSFKEQTQQFKKTICLLEDEDSKDYLCEVHRLLFLGRVYYYKSEYANAVHYSRQALEEEDTENAHSEIFHLLGRISFKTKNHTTAVNYYEKALDMLINRKKESKKINKSSVLDFPKPNIHNLNKYIQQNRDIIKERNQERIYVPLYLSVLCTIVMGLYTVSNSITPNITKQNLIKKFVIFLPKMVEPSKEGEYPQSILVDFKDNTLLDALSKINDLPKKIDNNSKIIKTLVNKQNANTTKLNEIIKHVDILVKESSNNHIQQVNRVKNAR